MRKLTVFVKPEIAVKVLKDTARFADIDFKQITGDRPNA
jgi:cell division control protein 6